MEDNVFALEKAMEGALPAGEGEPETEKKLKRKKSASFKNNSTPRVVNKKLDKKPSIKR